MSLYILSNFSHSHRIKDRGHKDWTAGGKDLETKRSREHP